MGIQIGGIRQSEESTNLHAGAQEDPVTSVEITNSKDAACLVQGSAPWTMVMVMKNKENRPLLNRPISFASDNQAVATVNADQPFVAPHADGVATITASSGAASATVKVTVKDACP